MTGIFIKIYLKTKMKIVYPNLLNVHFLPKGTVLEGACSLFSEDILVGGRFWLLTHTSFQKVFCFHDFSSFGSCVSSS